MIRARLPRSLYPATDGESVYEFEIYGCAGMLTCGGLITVRRHIDGRAEVVVSRFHADEVAVVVRADE